MEDGYVYEFTPEKSGQPIVLAAWHPTKASHEMKIEEGRKVLRGERMPVSREATEGVSVKAADGRLSFTGGEKSVLLWVQP